MGFPIVATYEYFGRRNRVVRSWEGFNRIGRRIIVGTRRDRAWTALQTRAPPIPIQSKQVRIAEGEVKSFTDREEQGPARNKRQKCSPVSERHSPLPRGPTSRLPSLVHGKTKVGMGGGVTS